MAWKAGDSWRDWAPLAGRPHLPSINACEREAWSLTLWPKAGEEAGQPKRIPFLCGSWRCRRCAAWRGAVDWRRCSKAVTGRDWWLYVVLTFDPTAYADKWEAFKEAGRCWNNSLRESFRHKAGKVEYLQTWEATRNGWPHVNIVLTGDNLRDVVEAGGIQRREHRGRTCLFPREFRRWMRDAAQRAGFGPVAWAEVLAPEAKEAMAGYLVKLATELVGAANKKGDQSPVQAPRHFRRIRASRGLLPAGPKGTGDWTGAVTVGRCVQTPSAARLPGVRAQPLPATWNDVEAIQTKIANEARREAALWGKTNGNDVSVLSEEIQNATQPRGSHGANAPGKSHCYVGGPGGRAETIGDEI